MSFGETRQAKRPGQLSIPDPEAKRALSTTTPKNSSPSGRSTPSPKLCAVSGCANKRFVRGYCAEHSSQQKQKGQSSMDKRERASSTPRSPGPDRGIPVNRENEVFRNVHKAWLEGWDSFVSRLKNPYAMPSGTANSFSRQVLEIIMRICEFVPSITSSAEWQSRESTMAGQAAQDVIMQWGGVLNAELGESVVLEDETSIKLLAMCILNFHTPDDGAETTDTPLVRSIRFNRNMCAQIMSSLSMNPQNALQLIQAGIVPACQKQFKVHLNLEEEDMTVQSILHFLIQGSYIWKIMPPEEYKARELARQVYQCVGVVLDVSTKSKHNASINARGRALMAVLVRISPHRCQEHCIEHTRAIYEVPKLLGSITHWFYERHLTSPSFEDVVTEVIRDLIQNTQSLPSFLQNTMKKALSFGTECAMCKRIAGPMVARCSCKGFFYCSRNCQSEHWPLHKADCKAAWQDDILQPSTQ